MPNEINFDDLATVVMHILTYEMRCYSSIDVDATLVGSWLDIELF